MESFFTYLKNGDFAIRTAGFNEKIVKTIKGYIPGPSREFYKEKKAWIINGHDPFAVWAAVQICKKYKIKFTKSGSRNAKRIKGL